MNNELKLLNNLINDVLHGEVKLPQVEYIDNLNSSYRGISETERNRIIENDFTASNAVRLYLDYSRKNNHSRSTLESKTKN